MNQQGWATWQRTLLLLVLCTASLAARLEAQAFPHDKHRNLFLNCTACHDGVGSGDVSRHFTVTAEDCAQCHDGSVQPQVNWQPPTPQPQVARFDHEVHFNDPTLDCASCHQSSPTSHRMEVVVPRVEDCLQCHQYADHFAQNTQCNTCHVPLSRTPAWTPARIAALPQPDSHTDPEFIRAHGDAAARNIARCSTCHTRDSCDRCHMNSELVEPILALESDGRMAQVLTGRQGKWPAPPSHDDMNWAWYHASLMEAQGTSVQSCTNCHRKENCMNCHGGEWREWMALFERQDAAGAWGVVSERQSPPAHDPDFVRTHGSMASLGLMDCTACHAPTQCNTCHEAPARPDFHPVNFLQRHSVEAWARDSDCSSCHSTEVFCRSCHADVGMSPSQVVNSSYHDASPNWLLTHGKASRMGMETCASCHQQTDCLKCHSSRSGWGVNPHGPDFDAERMADRSGVSCSFCHVGNPLD